MLHRSECLVLWSDICRSILGPALGGTLAQPCKNFPTIFANGTLFDRYPFLLPNLVCAVILACGVAVGVLFLEETHANKKHRRDLGIEAGRWLLKQLKVEAGVESKEEATQAVVDGVGSRLLDEPPECEVTKEESQVPDNRSSSSEPAHLGQDQTLGGVKHAFTKQVVCNIVGFGILA